MCSEHQLAHELLHPVFTLVDIHAQYKVQMLKQKQTTVHVKKQIFLYLALALIFVNQSKVTS